MSYEPTWRHLGDLEVAAMDANSTVYALEMQYRNETNRVIKQALEVARNRARQHRREAYVRLEQARRAARLGQALHDYQEPH